MASTLDARNRQSFLLSLGPRAARRCTIRENPALSISARPSISAFAEHEAEIAAIASNPDAPTFDNTIVALERSGQLPRGSAMCSGRSRVRTPNDELLTIEREISPLRARHWNSILMNKDLFSRIDQLMVARDTLGLTPEHARGCWSGITPGIAGPALAGRNLQGTAGANHRAARDARHQFQPERARRRA